MTFLKYMNKELSKYKLIISTTARKQTLSLFPFYRGFLTAITYRESKLERWGFNLTGNCNCLSLRQKSRQLSFSYVLWLLEMKLLPSEWFLSNQFLKQHLCGSLAIMRPKITRIIFLFTSISKPEPCVCANSVLLSLQNKLRSFRR